MLRSRTSLGGKVVVSTARRVGVLPGPSASRAVLAGAGVYNIMFTAADKTGVLELGSGADTGP